MRLVSTQERASESEVPGADSHQPRRHCAVGSPTDGQFPDDWRRPHLNRIQPVLRRKRPEVVLDSPSMIDIFLILCVNGSPLILERAFRLIRQL